MIKYKYNSNIKCFILKGCDIMLYNIIWIMAAIVFGIAEALTGQLISIWFALGSAASFIAALLGANLYIQFAVFIVVSIITTIATRPLAKKLLADKITSTNSDTLIGKKFIVSDDIDNRHSKGGIKIRGVEWTARSNDDNIVINTGEDVIVEKIEGVKLIVKKA